MDLTCSECNGNILKFCFMSLITLFAISKFYFCASKVTLFSMKVWSGVGMGGESIPYGSYQVLCMFIAGGTITVVLGGVKNRASSKRLNSV